MSTSDVTAEIHGFSQADATPTPWAAGLEVVSAADTFWISTVRPDGRPHVTPLVAVWHEDAIWFTTGAEERKAKNLARNPSCVLTTGRSDLAVGGLDVVLEGTAEQVTATTSCNRSPRRSRRSTARTSGTSWSATARSATRRQAGAPRCSACGRSAGWGSARATCSARRPGASRGERPADLQHEVQATIDELVASDAETGLQVAVLHEGARRRRRGGRSRRPADRGARRRGHPVLRRIDGQGRGDVGRARARRARRAQLRTGRRRCLAGVLRSRQGSRDPARRAAAHGRRAGPVAADHARGALRLGPRLRLHRRPARHGGRRAPRPATTP